MKQFALPLVGAGGEPISFAFTITSHGLAGLPPGVVPEDRSHYDYVVSIEAVIVRLRFHAEGDQLVVASSRSLSARSQAKVERMARNMFHLDANLAPFYAMIGDDDALSWARTGAGRFLASPSVFEDVIRTICTTNCAWSGTERMIAALVELGDGAFPDASTLAKTPERWFKDTARMGYRGPYVKSIARQVVAGKIDLDGLRPGRLTDDEVEEALLELDGVGPYAAAHIMQLLGYHRKLIFDSWTRPKFREISGKKQAKDSTIERFFARYKGYAGLAFWLYLTRGWHEEKGNLEHPS